MRNDLVQTVDRALLLLLAFRREGEEFGVTDLARHLGVHKSTASRLAATLEARRFLERSERDTFQLGPELTRLGRLARGGRDLVELARYAMEELARDTGETVNLAVADEGEVINVAQVDGRHIVGVGSWTGRRTPLHCTANGKALLVWAGASQPARLEAFTSHTITRPAALDVELAQVRARGYATAVGELEDGLHAVAAPVLEPGGRCVAALSVSGPSYRMSEPRLARVARACVVAAGEIGRLLDGGARAA